MNLEEWEEFWAHLVGDYSIIVGMGTNHLDTVGEFLEWQRQEWIKYLKDDPEHVDCGMTKAGREIIQSFEKMYEEVET